jgi:MFS family permease
VTGNKIILGAMTLDLFAVLLGGATALLPVFADKVVHVGPRGLGMMYAAPSVGAFVTAMILAHRKPMQHAGRNMLWAVVGFGAATIVFGLSRNFLLSLAALVFTGVFDNISVVVRHTLVQLLTPDSMRGRVNAVNSVFISCSNELGAFESGLTAAWLGPMTSVVAGGIGTIVVVGGVASMWPHLLGVKRLKDQVAVEPVPNAVTSPASSPANQAPSA